MQLGEAIAFMPDELVEVMAKRLKEMKMTDDIIEALESAAPVPTGLGSQRAKIRRNEAIIYARQLLNFLNEIDPSYSVGEVRSALQDYTGQR